MELTIGELSTKTGVPSKTIRYYESIQILPEAQRKENGYRVYSDSDVERLTFIRSARALDFTLDDIREILAFRDREEPPCTYVMGLMKAQLTQIDQRIAELERLRGELSTLYQVGRALPEDAQMKTCVCHLIETHADWTHRKDSDHD